MHFYQRLLNSGCDMPVEKEFPARATRERGGSLWPCQEKQGHLVPNGGWQFLLPGWVPGDQPLRRHACGPPWVACDWRHDRAWARGSARRAETGARSPGRAAGRGGPGGTPLAQGAARTSARAPEGRCVSRTVTRVLALSGRAGASILREISPAHSCGGSGHVLRPAESQ